MDYSATQGSREPRRAIADGAPAGKDLEAQRAEAIAHLTERLASRHQGQGSPQGEPASRETLPASKPQVARPGPLLTLRVCLDFQLQMPTSGVLLELLQLSDALVARDGPSYRLDLPPLLCALPGAGVGIGDRSAEHSDADSAVASTESTRSLPPSASSLRPDLWFDADGCQLLKVSQGALSRRELSGQERALLVILLHTPGRWYSAGELAHHLQEVYLLSEEVADAAHCVKTIICNLRRKLDNQQVCILRTKRQVGYSLFPQIQ